MTFAPRFSTLISMAVFIALHICGTPSLIASDAVLPQDGVEFNGPYASWLNVRDFGAVGDGVHDDTQAIEDALQALGLGLTPAAIYFPNGIYRITRTIQFPHPSFARGVLGKLVMGEDPATTRLLWDGPEGGDMLWLAGQAHMRYGRLTFDGNDKAAIAIRIERIPQFNLYSSYVQIHDCTFIGSDYGIYNTNRTGTHAMDAEYSVLRCAFIGMKQAGIRIDAGNAYDYWIRHCRFLDCRIGVQNTYGDFYVMQSRFMRSTDADIVARSHRAGGIRDNVSIGSQQFLRMSGGRYVVQGNRVLNLVGDTAIEFNPDFSFTGLLAFDNVIHAERPIQAIHSGESKFLAPVAIIDNIITSEARFVVAQESGLLSGNQQTPPDKIDRSIPPLPGTPLKVARPVISLGEGDNDLQAKINEAAELARATPGQRPVVHIAPGEHTLQSTVIVFEAADDARNEPLESGHLTIDPDAAYLCHPDRVTSTLVEIKDNDPIRVNLAPAGGGRFTLTRNGNQGLLKVPLVRTRGQVTRGACERKWPKFETLNRGDIHCKTGTPLFRCSSVALLCKRRPGGVDLRETQCSAGKAELRRRGRD